MVVIGSFLLAIIFVMVNGITQFFYSKSFGYKLKPTGLAYFIGVIGNLFTGSVVPISGQAETLTMSGLIKNLNERVGALLIAAAVGIILGLTGQVSRLVEFCGNGAINGMMVGVGLILAKVGIDMCKQEKRVGIISIIFALIIYFLSHDLVYTIAGSVLISTLDFCLLQKRRVDLNSLAKEYNQEPENTSWKFWTKEYWNDFKLLKPTFNKAALLGGLSIIMLNIASNISFSKITSEYIAGVPMKINAVTVINSLADIPSVLFGGAVLETIISGTGAAPNIGNISGPWLAGILMMFLSGILLLLGIVSKLGKYIPSQSISAFLILIGIVYTAIPSLKAIGNPIDILPGIFAFIITFFSYNGFYGMIAGCLVFQFPKIVELLFPTLL
jgi:AGZA family xanthine/uracil permease-like MFS transporter